MAEHLINSESIYLAGVFPDMATLKTVNTYSLPQGTWAYVEESGTGEYYLDLNSVLNESAPNILNPYSGPGRWIQKDNTIVSNYNLLKQISLSGVDPNAFLKFASGFGIDSEVTGPGVLNIGTSNADVINLGSASTTVNIPGTLAYNDVTNLEVTDKVIILNHGGAAASGMGGGIEIEEDGAITGYIKVASDREGFDIKAPGVDYLATLNLSQLTSNRVFQFPDEGGTLALLSDLPESFSNGLVLDSGHVKLGGILTQNTYIDSDPEETRHWIIGNTNKLGWFEVYALGDIWFEYHGASDEFAQIILDNRGISLSSNYALQYAAKLRTDNITAERIIQFPDAEGTLALTSDIPESFSNGLVLDSGHVKLGGTLTENTAINAATDDSIRFEMGSATRLYWFEIYARADIWLETVSAVGGDLGRLIVDNQGVSISSNPNIPGLYGVYGASLRTDDLTDQRIFQFPDQAGTFALTSDLPGSYSNGLTLDSGVVKIGGELTQHTYINSDTDGAWRWEIGSTNKLAWFEVYARNDVWFEYHGIYDEFAQIILDNAGISLSTNHLLHYAVHLRTDDVTDHRFIQFPDAAGTIALTSDLSSYLPLTGGTISGNLTMSSATASTIAEFDSSKQLVGTKAIIDAFLTSGATTSLLENSSNWTGKTYTGTPITDTYQGQRWYDANYLYEAVDDNIWIRLTRA